MEMAPLLAVYVGGQHSANDTQEDATDKFIQQYEKDSIGHLSGFNRLVLRGTLRALVVKSGMGLASTEPT